MGFLSFFKSRNDGPPEFPSGSFTVDSQGQIIVSTISSQFSEEKLLEISNVMLAALAEGRSAGLGDLTFRLGAITIRAVDLRGGAMIFLSPR